MYSTCPAVYVRNEYIDTIRVVITVLDLDELKRHNNETFLITTVNMSYSRTSTGCLQLLPRCSQWARIWTASSWLHQPFQGRFYPRNHWRHWTEVRISPEWGKEVTHNFTARLGASSSRGGTSPKEGQLAKPEGIRRVTCLDKAGLHLGFMSIEHFWSRDRNRRLHTLLLW